MKTFSAPTAFLVAALVAGIAHSSEGLLLAAAYECAPVQVTEAVVGACVKTNPSRAADFEDALRSWKRRSEKLASEAETSCLSLSAKTAKSVAEQNAMTQQMHQNLKDAIAFIEADVAKNPESCTSTLSTLRSESSNYRPLMPGVR